MTEVVKNRLAELGMRLKQARINAGITQIELADIIGMSVIAIKGAEKGKCKLETFVSIIYALELDSHIDLFLPKVLPSPVLLERATADLRQRASRKRRTLNEDDLGW